MPPLKREPTSSPPNPRPARRARSERSPNTTNSSSTTPLAHVNLRALKGILTDEIVHEIEKTMSKRPHSALQSDPVRSCKLIRRAGSDVPVLAITTLTMGGELPTQVQTEPITTSQTCQDDRRDSTSTITASLNPQDSQAINARIQSLGMMSAEWFHLLFMLLCGTECEPESFQKSLAIVEDRLGTPLKEFMDACQPGFQFGSNQAAIKFMAKLPYTILMATGKFTPQDISSWGQPAFDTFINRVRDIVGLEEAFSLLCLTSKLPDLAKDPSKAATQWKGLRPLFARLVERDYIKKQEEAVRAMREIVSSSARNQDPATD